MSALAAAASTGGIAVGLGIAVSVSIVVAALVKTGRWVGSVEDRLTRHGTALKRLGTAVADDEQEDPR